MGGEDKQRERGQRKFIPGLNFGISNNKPGYRKCVASDRLTIHWLFLPLRHDELKNVQHSNVFSLEDRFIFSLSQLRPWRCGTDSNVVHKIRNLSHWLLLRPRIWSLNQTFSTWLRSNAGFFQVPPRRSQLWMTWGEDVLKWLNLHFHPLPAETLSEKLGIRRMQINVVRTWNKFNFLKSRWEGLTTKRLFELEEDVPS